MAAKVVVLAIVTHHVIQVALEAVKTAAQVVEEHVQELVMVDALEVV